MSTLQKITIKNTVKRQQSREEEEEGVGGVGIILELKNRIFESLFQRQTLKAPYFAFIRFLHSSASASVLDVKLYRVVGGGPWGGPSGLCAECNFSL